MSAADPGGQDAFYSGSAALARWCGMLAYAAAPDGLKSPHKEP